MQLINIVVALRKESVDRNVPLDVAMVPAEQSLSARRAWIEIPTYRWQRSGIVKSLSARRAWIEIDPVTDKAWALEGRSPQGERG